jgi:hypothetical protein
MDPTNFRAKRAAEAKEEEAALRPIPEKPKDGPAPSGEGDPQSSDAASSADEDEQEKGPNSATANANANAARSGAPASKRLFRTHRHYEDMEGDADANLRDTGHFKTFPKYFDWEEFHNGRFSARSFGGLGAKTAPEIELDPKKLIVRHTDSSGKEDEFESVNIPSRVIGLLRGEKVLAAWDELPQMTFALASPVFIGSGLTWFLLAAYHSDEQLNFLGNHREWASDLIISVGVCLVCLFLLYVWLKISLRHVVIITDRRFIEIRFQEICRLCCTWTIQLRVDMFRHDHNLSYGSFRTLPPSIYARYKEHVGKGPRWTPGAAVAQCGFFGIVEMSRQRGNIVGVYQILCQLVVCKGKHVSENDVMAAGVDWNKLQTNVKKNMERVLSDVWRIKHRQPDDQVEHGDNTFFPDMFMASDLEEPIFYWAFKEYGPLSSALSFNTDVIITSNRVFKYTRASYKPFDCRLCLFVCCYCTALKKLIYGRKYNYRSASFLMLDFMLTYCSEITVEPPSWRNPMRPPIRCPCWESMCKVCTAFWGCNCCGDSPIKKLCTKAKFEEGAWDMNMTRGPAMAQLWMLWRHRFNGIQPDLMAVVRPLNQPEIAFIEDCYSTLGFGTGANKKGKYAEDDMLPKSTKFDVDKSEMLQKIMGVIQDKTHKKDSATLRGAHLGMSAVQAGGYKVS